MDIIDLKLFGEGWLKFLSFQELFFFIAANFQTFDIIKKAFFFKFSSSIYTSLKISSSLLLYIE